jgi:hypothetical protein
VIADVIGALLANQAHPLVGARGADHGAAVRAGDLDGCHADAAAGTMDEHGFPRARLPADEQRSPRRPVRDTDRRPLLKRDAVRKRVDLPLFGQRELGVATRRAVRIDAIADLHARHAGAERRHDTAEIAARRVRERRFARICAGAHVGLDRVDANRVHPDQDLTRAGGGIGGVFELQHLRSAELAHDDGFHEVILAGRR